MLVGQWILALGVILALFFVRAPLWAWLSSAAVWLLLGDLYDASFGFIDAVSWLLLVAVTAIFAVPMVRRQIITARLMPVFKKLLPTISETEQAALDAGDTWWEAKLFQGLPKWYELINTPKSTLTADEQSFVDNQASTLCEMLNAWEINEAKDFPDEVWQYIKDNKFLGMVIPKEYGGLGFSALAHSQVVTKIASVNLSAAVTVMVPNSLGPGELLLHYGTDEQKQQYLSRLANGQEIPCFGLTGPNAGSDAGAMTDTGIVTKGHFQGKEVLGISLSFDKRYITLAPVATLIGLAFKLKDPNKLLGDKEDLGITLALMPAATDGIEIGQRHLPANGSFMNGPIRGQDIFIPLDWIIGGQKMIGQGWRMLMECLATGRGISLPALAAAMGAHTYRTTGAYAKLRQQFGVAIGEFEGIQEAMGRIGANAYQLEALRTMTLCAIDEGYNPAICTAISKYHMTELARESIIDAMDIHAGKAVIEGPTNYLSQYYQGIPVAITVEGANILTRNLMIFGQGAIRCHPYVIAQIQGLNNQDQSEGLKQFDKAFFAHVGYAISNFVHAFTLGLTRGWYRPKPDYIAPEIAQAVRDLTRMSSALSFVSDMTMLVVGGDLKRRESLSARLGDVLSELYKASAVIRYYEHHNRQKEDLVYVQYCLQKSLYNIKQAFDEFLQNFPNKWVALFMRSVIAPLGFWGLHKPKDRLANKIAQSMMLPTAIRQRLSATAHLAKDENSQLALLERGLAMSVRLEPVFARIKQAMRERKIAKTAHVPTMIEAAKAATIINQKEYEELLAFAQCQDKVIRVDEFNADYFKRMQTQCQNSQTTQIA